jgi:hypothetical protein
MKKVCCYVRARNSRDRACLDVALKEGMMKDLLWTRGAANLIKRVNQGVLAVGLEGNVEVDCSHRVGCAYRPQRGEGGFARLSLRAAPRTESTVTRIQR